MIGLDLGSGQGRSVQVLKNNLKCDVVALDLSFGGLLRTSVKDRVQAKAEELPFKAEVFDFVSACGLMTNIVDSNPMIAKGLRKKVAEFLYSVVKPGGCVCVSDFGAEHLFDDYPVNYDRHKLITEEDRTIAVLKWGDFGEKSDAEIKRMKGTEQIERYAHHYLPQELVSLFQGVGFGVEEYTVGLVRTPRGNRPIENIVMLMRKSPASIAVWLFCNNDLFFLCLRDSFCYFEALAEQALFAAFEHVRN